MRERGPFCVQQRGDSFPYDFLLFIFYFSSGYNGRVSFGVLIRSFTRFTVRTHKLTNLLWNDASKGISISSGCTHAQRSPSNRKRKGSALIGYRSQPEQCLGQRPIIAPRLPGHHFVV